MKFIIDTSYKGDKTQPIPGAEKGTYIEVDARSAACPKDIPLHKNEPTDWWYKHGSNHRVVNGHIRRDLTSEKWFIEINTLEELLQLQQTYGNLSISIGDLNYQNGKCLIIYINQKN